MDKKLKFLLLEDRHEDVEIIKRELKSKGFPCIIKHVEDKNGFISELEKFNPDLILSDYNLPAFNGLDALSFVVERKIDLPFIFVTGSINEETAVSCIQKGATDYVIKENLQRLIPAINNALEKFNSKREKVKAQNALLQTEEKFSHAFNNANIGMCMIDLK
jgi:CheY-like chemotaxis protein